MHVMEMNEGELISFVFGGKVELFHGSIFNTICKLADCESNVPHRFGGAHVELRFHGSHFQHDL
jgi:hypothetical protein